MKEMAEFQSRKIPPLEVRRSNRGLFSGWNVGLFLTDERKINTYERILVRPFKDSVIWGGGGAVAEWSKALLLEAKRSQVCPRPRQVKKDSVADSL